jgi:hypothetical protein
VTDLLSQAATAVYAVEPGEFIASRKEWVATAKAAGDKEAAAAIGVLRKPSVSAWAMNAVVRGAPEVVDALRDVGARMRDAQSRMDMASVQGMRGERESAVSDYVSAAARVTADAGRPLAASGLDEVRATAIAALADASAEMVMASGTLTRALSYSGFGEVDLSDAVVLTKTGRVLGVISGGGGGGSLADANEPGASDADMDAADHPTVDPDHEQKLAAARMALEDAEDELAEVSEEIAVANENLERAQAAVAAAERQLSVVTKRAERLRRRRDEALRSLNAIQS